MYASPSRLPQPGALLNSYGLVVCVISGIKLDSYKKTLPSLGNTYKSVSDSQSVPAKGANHSVRESLTILNRL
jgi:hypothetical protein